MNFLQLSKVITLISFVLIHSNAVSQSPVKVCITGRAVANLQTYGQSFVNGATLAVEQSKLSNEIMIKEYFYNNRPLEPARIYEAMIQDGCSAVIGFEYLSDLLLAIKKQTNNRVPIFTSYASSISTEKMPKNIFMFMPTYDFLANKMLAYLHKHYNKLEAVLIITEINRDEMMKYKEVYSSVLSKDQINFDTFDFLENDDRFEAKLKTALINKKYKYVFLLSGAMASAKIANMMNDHNVIFIGTENYGSSVSPTFYIRINDKLIHSYFIRNLDFLKPSAQSTAFENTYIKKYHTKPTLLSMYTYDAMTIIANSIRRTGKVNINNIYHNNYTGITGAYLKSNKFHRSDNYVILSVGQDGYKYEE